MIQTNLKILMNQENQSKAKLGTGNVLFIMCTIFQSLRFHRAELKIEPGNYEKKPGRIALTETWLTENDVIEKMTITCRNINHLNQNQEHHVKIADVLLFIFEKVWNTELLCFRVKLKV